MKIAVAQLGARRHYAVPRIFHEAGLLERLFTDTYVGNKPWLEAALRCIPEQVRPRATDRWLGRTDRILPSGSVTSFDLFGAEYRQRLSRARRSSELQSVFAWAGREFGRRVAQVGFGKANAVWGFTGESLELFEAAKRASLHCVVEQTIAPFEVQRSLLGAEMQRWPGWQPDLELADEVTENERRQAAEWELADLIVCGSQFVVDAIAQCGGPVDKCRVVAYGVDLERFRMNEPRQRAPGDRLRVLFAGEVGLRKGAPWLLEALRSLGPSRVEARLAGRLALSRDKLAPYAEVATFLGAVPRSRMAELFAWADLFVLPSVCEGSATVVYEAVASGLPVICTANTGAVESPAVTIVPLGDTTALAEAIAKRARDGASTPVPSEVRRLYGLEVYAARLLAAVCERDRHHPASDAA